MSRTIENLENAFAGESQANRRYLAFSQSAYSEGFGQVAKLFKAAAEAETIHALNHLRIKGEVKSTVENLSTAVSGETFEFTKMYPEYLQIAEEEQNKQAAWSFDIASKVERVHAGLFRKAKDAVEVKKDLDAANYYVCRVCGNTIENVPPGKCPICGAQKTAFFEIV